MTRPLADEFRAARRDRSLVVLEGFHALKHALRFGAVIERVVVGESAPLDALVAQLAPDLTATLPALERVDDAALTQFVPRAPRTGVVALARRPAVALDAVVGASSPEPIVLLEEPRTMGNVGAVVRVAAAAGAAAVLTTGPHDPWHPDAVRGGAGLQFALPVVRIDAPTTNDALDVLGVSSGAGGGGTEAGAGRPLIALDPDGVELGSAGEGCPPGAILAFGTERDGLSDALLARVSARVRLAMRPGVSSLNLATSVAATLYSWRVR